VVSCNFDFLLERVHEGVTLTIYTRYCCTILLNIVHNKIPGSKLRNKKFNSYTLPTKLFLKILRVIFWHNVPSPPPSNDTPLYDPPFGVLDPPLRVIYGGHPKCPMGNTQRNFSFNVRGSYKGGGNHKYFFER